MTTERTFIAGLLTFLVFGTLLDLGSTDGMYIAATVGFFLLCIAYSDWCSRL
jgi:hypothetical protein